MSASNVRPYAVSVSGQIGPQSTGGTVVYYGFSLRETAGATAVVRFRANGLVTGDIIDSVSLVANESAREWYGPQGVNAGSGVYVQIVSGTVEGAVRAG